MKVNELRIGNYVNAEVGLLSLQVHKLMPSDIVDASKGIIEIYPISLTEDILLKCGFEQTSIISIFEKDEFTIENWDDNEFIFRWNDFTISVDLKHLHTLQNLYFALKNEELEINL